MTKLLRPLVALLAGTPVAFASSGKSCGAEACCQPKPPACCAVTPVAGTSANNNAETTRHPLRGIITAVHADRSAIMVKHEEIPGVMRAMTMLFKVDEATLKAAKQGQAITGMMSRQGTEWWLHDVKFVAAKKG